jgi:hypothetical protein
MDLIYDFNVALYGQMEPYNDVLSHCRCRIFYKYANRNGTFITDEFANKLISTVAYAPIKGIYDGEDYEGHGTSRTEGRIYGIVPESHNFAWEKHLDEDGVMREYACVDVLIFTALYEEAKDIIGKSQSMELYHPSVKYHKQKIDGQEYFVFDDACFLGLQVLGDNVEPCFEGASFFALHEQIENTIFQIKQLAEETGGKKNMFNFKLSDQEKYDKLFSALNPNCNEEGGWVIDYMVFDVYDDYAIARNTEDKFIRVYYTKNDETNEVEIGEMVECFIVDVTADELKTLNAIKQINGGNYNCVRPEIEKVDEIVAEKSELETKLVDASTENATLNTENEKLAAQVAELETEAEARKAELNALQSYKEEIETAAKNAIIEEYAAHLEEAVLDEYRTNIANYTEEELDKELAYEMKKHNQDFFSKEYQYTPKPTPVSGLNAILSKYESK